MFNKKGIYLGKHTLYHVPKLKSKIRKHPYYSFRSKHSPNIHTTKIALKLSEDCLCLVNVKPCSLHIPKIKEEETVNVNH